MHSSGQSLFICLVILVSSCNSGEEKADDKYLENVLFSETAPTVTLWLGSEQDSVMIGRAGEMHLDLEGNIYVSDLTSQSIKKLSRQRKLIAAIGQRGRNAGEFMNLRSFQIVSASTEGNQKILANAFVNKTISVFDTNGKLYATYRVPETIFFPRGPLHEISIDDKTKYLYLYKLHQEAIDSGCLFHLFNRDFTRKEGCYGDFDKLSYASENTFRYLTEALAGNFIIDEDKNIYFTPALYDGNIYKYSFDFGLNMWNFSKKLRGYVYNSRPFKENTEPVHYRFNYKSESFSGKFVNISQGLFLTSTGLIHFTTITDSSDTIQFGMERYKDGKLVSYKKITDINLKEKDQLFKVLQYDDRDSSYYFSGYSDPGKIYRMKF